MRARLSLVLLALLAILGCSTSEDGGSVPIIIQFIPAKANVAPGGSTLLVANFLGGSATVDQGVGPIQSGVAVTVTPAQTTTYTLTVKGTKGDTAIATTTVTVGARSLDVSPATVTVAPGGPITFTANAQGVSSGQVTWFAEQGSIDALGNHTASSTPGTYLVSATSTVDKTLCAKALVTVVSGPAPVIVGPVLPANPLITVGGAQTFTATASGGVTNRLTWSATAGTMNPLTGAWTAPGVPQTVTITATSAENPARSSSTTVTVLAAPIITAFTATPATVGFGGSSSLAYTFANGSATVDQGIGAVTSGGTSPTGALTANRTYTLTVTNAAGTSVTQAVTVSVTPVAIGLITPATPTVSVGTGTTFSVTVTGGATNSVTWSATAGTINAGTGAWTAPATAQTVTIQAASNDDPSKSASTSVTVVALPAITAFTATPATISYGAGTTLSYTFSGGTGSIDQGIGAVVSGGSTPTGALIANRTYTLTVTNAAGATTTQAVTVSVTPVAVGPLSPAAPTVSVGAARTFSTTVTGGVTNAVTWTASAGAINASTGAWTAPATPQSVTIQATSQEDPTKFATTTVTVVALPAISIFTLRDIGSAAPLWVFDATYTGGTGIIDRGVGAIASGGQVPLGGTPIDVYTLTVTNAAGDSVTRTVSNVQISIESPSSPTNARPGGKLTVLYTVFNATNTSVTFSAAGGSITSGGAFTAPMGVQPCTITVTSVADPTVSRTITVNVIPLVYPQSQVVAPGASFVFRAASLGVSNPAVTWSITPATAGSISSSGVFTSNGTTGSVTVTATSVAFPTISADAFVTVQPSFAYTNTLTVSSGAAITTRRIQVPLVRSLSDLVVAAGGLNGSTTLASIEIFNPSGQFWSLSGVTLATARSRHTATLLPTGQILLAGGRDAAGNPLASAELYDPSFDSVTPVSGTMASARMDHTATLMVDGRVLIAGGQGAAGTLASLEVFDPATGAFSPVAASMAEPRVDHAAVALLDGRILLAGGSKDGTDSGSTSTADLFTPSTGAVAATAGAMSTTRRNAGVVLGADGIVSLLGGIFTPSVPVVSAGIDRFNPTTGTFSLATSALSSGRNRPLTTILADGTALALGGSSDLAGTTATGTLDVYNPITTAFPTFGFNVPFPGIGTDQLTGRCILLYDGTVLIVGDRLNGAGAPVGSVIYQ